ncbi:MAG: hypothetical protein QNJ40_21930 [Xanthomonadales bacterium]|nr:hypothetical protein [Xanthomonadales bacterium]
MSKGNRTVLMLLALVALSACTSQTVKKVNTVQVSKADQELSQDALLDIGIVVFHPGVEDIQEEPGKDNVYSQVRKAEARYIPYVLRTTLESSNQWGAVRVLPENDPASEIEVTGRIVESDGVELKVEVRAVDSTGRVWLDKEYEDLATQFAYRDDIDYNGDAFQDLYNRVSNDLAAYRARLKPEQLRMIRTVASLKYAAELSPEAFGSHINVDQRSGKVVINRLPSDRDPMLARVNRIRESEYLFVDTVDQQYAAFFREMDPSYDQWRRFSYEETLAMQDVKRSARTRALAGLLGIAGGAAISGNANNSAMRQVGNAAALGGLYAVKQSFDTFQQAKIHEEALKELAASFDSEVQPIVLEVEGEVVKLNGSLESQYSEWRRLLREIYSAEVGLPATDRVPQTQ